MNLFRQRSKCIPCVLILMGLILFPGLSPAQSAGRTPADRTARTPQGQAGAARFVSIDFNDVDINVFIKFISELTGKNFVVDRRVKGKVTIISPTKISVEEAYTVFLSVLEVHGFTTVDSGKVVKVVPAPDARSKSIETLTRGQKPRKAEDKVVTQLIPLKYADPTQIKRLFTPLISKSSVMLDYPPTNMLIVTDTLSNIQRLTNILETIDVMGIGQEISVIPLDHADATKMVQTLDSVFQEPQTTRRRKGAVQKTIKFVPDERTNTIVLLASEVDTLRVKKLIGMLDKETPRDKGKIRVYYLENSTAEDLAKVLQELPTKQTAAAAGKKTVPVVSEKVRITADKATNSLIIMADADDYAVLEDIIQKLDIPRAMVYIESLIMEVSVDKSFDLGIDWQTFSNSADNIYGGGFSPNIDGTIGAEDLVPNGFSLGFLSQGIEIGNVLFPDIAAVVRAFKSDGDVRIVSTPQILTTDNEEAQITIADNIPFQTTTSTSDNDTFNSFEYRDVGSILKITPHITKGRLVRLKIAFEFSTVTSEAETLQPTTRKRAVDTTIIVQDSHTIVIGGLIDDNLEQTHRTVPCLGEIPGIKWLFSSVSRNTDKTNLYVFLTPRVVQNPDEADQIYRGKRDELDQIREGKIKLYENLEENIPRVPETPLTPKDTLPPGNPDVPAQPMGAIDSGSDRLVPASSLPN